MFPCRFHDALLQIGQAIRLGRQLQATDSYAARPMADAHQQWQGRGGVVCVVTKTAHADDTTTVPERTSNSTTSRLYCCNGSGSGHASMFAHGRGTNIANWARFDHHESTVEIRSVAQKQAAAVVVASSPLSRESRMRQQANKRQRQRAEKQKAERQRGDMSWRNASCMVPQWDVPNDHPFGPAQRPKCSPVVMPCHSVQQSLHSA